MTAPSPLSLVGQTRDLRLFEYASSQRWKIFLLEGSAPEQVAMLQALYSRSPKSIKDRILDLAKKEPAQSGGNRLGRLSASARERLEGFLYAGETKLDDLSEGRRTNLANLLETAGRELVNEDDKAVLEKVAAFMAQYYVAYGHKSIGDCGTTVLFIEGVPLHLPTQIQDSALYSGQEASTRYLKMSDAYVWDPLGTDESAAIQADWMKFNRESLPKMIDYLRATHPCGTNEKPDVYERALNARSFDILRGFLPVGVSTNLSWAVNLRQANDHLRLLRCHPDPLVQLLGKDLLAALQAQYPKSFSHEERPETNAWLSEAIAQTIDALGQAYKQRGDRMSVSFEFDRNPSTEALLSILRSRPSRAEVPKQIGALGRVEVLTSMDFGSFRDLHRHRAMKIPTPLITWSLDSVEDWYLKQLPDELRRDAEALLRVQYERYLRLDQSNPYLLQNYCPIGTKIPAELRGDLGPLIYLLELRSKNDVHQTVRNRIWEIADAFSAHSPDLPLTIDRRPDAFNVARGSQTIIDKTTGHDVAGHSAQKG